MSFFNGNNNPSESDAFFLETSPFFTREGFVSNEALDMILGEVHRLNDPEFEYSMCGCQVRKSCGIPCACVLSAYLFSGEYIPLESIDIFWRTLDVSWSKPLEDEDIQCDDDLHIFKENFNKQSNVGTMSFLRKLGCISNPSALLIKEHAVKKILVDDLARNNKKRSVMIR
ncbi:hypothetical protein CTI12_AA623520 [Artemisia annua]|uniref:Protein FAR1-RELATED SEQUENCE n=1 Tax=Artemisia annua TaxID=35608 RepID=A0A2U1KB43_ARTAN|nr:hypothetical protein CTI12_AA623520 [Artemisia annua]